MPNNNGGKNIAATNSIEAKARLETFLRTHKVEGTGVYHTHTAYGEPWGKFDIPDDDMETFIDLYHQALQARVDLHITERPKNVGPLLIDIDFNFDKKNDDRYYKENDIKYIIGHINSIVRNYYVWNSKALSAFVCEKSNATTKKNNQSGKIIYKDGFHIIYPFLPLSENMRFVIVHELKTKIKDANGFKHIPYTNEKGIDDVVDMSVIKQNGWMMYGSRKDNGPWYKLTHIYTCTFEEKDIHKYKHLDLIRILSNRKFNNEDELKFKDNIDQEKINNILKQYGLLKKDNRQKTQQNKKADKLKINLEENNEDEDGYENEDDDNNDEDDDISIDEQIEDVCEDSDDDTMSNDIQSIRAEILSRRKEQNRTHAIKNKAKETKLAKKLIMIMSKDRAISYHDWIRVGWALYNVSSNLLDAFKEFSKKAKKKYDEKSCEQVWEKCRNDGFTIASLRHWAKQDNPEKYAEILSEDVNELIVEAESGTEYDVAKVVHELYKEIYKCTSIKHDSWYEFQGHRWVNVEGAYTLSSKLSEDLTKEFAILNTLYMKQMSLRHGTDNDSFLKRSTNVLKIMTNLKKSGFKDRVIKECKNMFYDSRFEEKLDSNRNLIGFDNGIFDLEAGKFRSGTPDDAVSLTVGYDYEEYNLTHEYVIGLKDYFSKVQREKDMREYLLTLLSSYLDGHTKKEQFIIWTGSGCHAAGTEIRMYDHTLKKVEDILPGDKLMGDDYQMRMVKHLYRGQDHMYKVIQHNGITYVVNGSHRLAVKFQGDKELFYDIERRRYTITWYEFDDYYAIKKNYKFFKLEELEAANQFHKNLEKNINILHKDHVVIITVDHYLKLDVDIQKLLYGYKKDISYPINIEYSHYDNYYGFEINDNQRYLLSDGTVTCNSNGKSKTVELFQMAFGDYCGVLPVTFLTQKRGCASAATPELAQQRGKRFVVFQEPENNDKIQVGYMKELTGGDWVYARPLFKDPIRFKPQFKLLLTCNRLPQIPSTDGGTWRRIRVSPWESEFVDDPKQPHQFAKDYDLLEKLELWKKAFLWLLLHVYYPKYIKNGLSEPDKVTEFTRKYKKQSDMFFEFIDSTLTLTGDNKDIEDYNCLYAAFKFWYSESCTGKCPFNKKDLVEYFTNNNYKVDKNYLFGVMFKSEEDNNKGKNKDLD